MKEETWASIDSQLGEEPCLCEDTEEMFWLRQSDDYESKVKLGNCLSRQYRFKEAIAAYELAQKIRSDDRMLYIRLGGAYLTLFQYKEARSAYEKAMILDKSEKTAAYPMGILHYLQEDYEKASEWFGKTLPCDGETEIAILYWNALCSMRGGFSDALIATYLSTLEVGHHTAYKDAVLVMRGELSVTDALLKAEQDKNDLNSVVLLYGISIYLEHLGKMREARETTDLLLERKGVWPCISYLAAWNDKQNR